MVKQDTINLSKGELIILVVIGSYEVVSPLTPKTFEDEIFKALHNAFGVVYYETKINKQLERLIELKFVTKSNSGYNLTRHGKKYVRDVWKNS